ncbi:hypothetical protein C2845_PM02G14970 [Panicum miliaceum]|uniref:Dirigent protein n=1 Tax=Panicum miliaceum TaxID=4540 RepID=A0A3L6S7S0_PANMI|nr:hypothetical protein C2845_PM02G14970 [Panicum miliaceum]
MVFCVLVLSSTEAAVGEAAGGDVGRPTTHLHFYFHENFSGGPDGTAVQVSAARGGLNNGSFFGVVNVVDDMLREGADPASRLLQRGFSTNVPTYARLQTAGMKGYGRL